MGHYEEAERLLGEAREVYLRSSRIATAAECTGLGTLEAILALLDYIQDIDSQEPVFDPMSPQVIVLQNRIRHLEDDLEGARAALRARDDEITIETNRGDKRK